MTSNSEPHCSDSLGIESQVPLKPENVEQYSAAKTVQLPDQLGCHWLAAPAHTFVVQFASWGVRLLSQLPQNRLAKK
jgi:hypothetical protein